MARWLKLICWRFDLWRWRGNEPIPFGVFGVYETMNQEQYERLALHRAKWLNRKPERPR